MFKKGLIFVLALMLCASVSAYEPPDNYVMLGGSYSAAGGEKTFSGSVGAATHLGSGIWTLGRMQAGSYGQIEGDMAKFFRPTEKTVVGLVAGPGVDFIEQEGADPLTYMTLSCGAIGGYQWELTGGWLSPEMSLGVFGGAKYKFGDDGYPNGWEAGLYLGLGW